MDDRRQLRDTFDSAADLYHRARPRYPSALYDHLLEITELSPPDRLLEVGCGTGIATLPLAQRGFDITCLELGGALAAAARENLSRFPHVRIENVSMEQWETSRPVDLVYAATAWHWIDSNSRYQLAAKVLRPDGFLAFWSAAHVFPDDGDPFFAELQEVYDEIGERLPADYGWPRPGHLQDLSEEIQRSGLFNPVLVRHFDWETLHDAESYIDLLRTFSGHIKMEPWQRDRLFGAIRERVNSRKAPVVRRHWGCVLHVAKRN